MSASNTENLTGEQWREVWRRLQGDGFTVHSLGGSLPDIAAKAGMSAADASAVRRAVIEAVAAA